MSKIKTAFLETRPHFLLLSLILVLIGSNVAYYQGVSHIPHMVLSLFGLLAFHISVNVLNDYHDFKSGIDLNTKRTPFSGGSGFLPLGKISPETVKYMGLTSLGIGCLIGLYLTSKIGWQLVPILLLGIFSVYFYNTFLSKFMLGEIFAGLGLGLLPVIGVFLVITGRLAAIAFAAGVPSFFLTFNLLFLNEFPDTEADKSGGRRHLVIMLGKKKAGIFYCITSLSVYIWISGGVILKIFPMWVLLALLTLPVSIKAIKGAFFDYDNFEKFIQAQGANIIVVLVTQALFAIGFFIAAF
ncbi:MAG: prenyltransferase [bacterium]